MADEMILEYGEGQDIDAVNAAALSNKLQQMANGAVYDESGNVRNIHDRKLDALEEKQNKLLKELDTQIKVSNATSMIEIA